MKKLDALEKKIVSKLKKEGFCIVEKFLGNKECEIIKERFQLISAKMENNRFFTDERSKYGQLVVRDVVLRDPKNFLPLLDKKLVVNVLSRVFKDVFILDNCMGSNSVNVESNHESLVHIDSHLPTANPDLTTDIVVMYCFDNFKKNNGATKVWPKSHLSGIRIQNDLNYKKNTKKYYKYVETKKGSIVFFLGQTWHQIGKNINSDSRWGLLCHYKKWWIKPSTDFTKCGSSIFKMLNPKQKELFGFTSISPRFDLKRQIRTLKTLRKVENLSKNYSKVIRY